MPTGKDWVNKSYSIKITDVETVLADIDKIAKRERKSRSALTVEALKEYRDKHIGGNYQTMLLSYAAGTPRSQNQIENEILELLKRKGKLTGHLGRREIVETLRENGFKGKNRISIAQHLSRRLEEAGIKIWS